MRSLLVVLLSLGAFGSCQCEPDPVPTLVDVVDLVDPFIGTGGGGYSQAQAFVGATLPFGMVKPGPDSSGPLLGSTGFAHTAGYWYHDDHIDGFSLLHFHGTGVEDYGNFLFMPTLGVDASKTSESGYRQFFRHSREQASPGYYQVQLEDLGVDVELTASLHAAVQRYSFAAGSVEPAVVVDLGHGLGRTGCVDSEVQWDASAAELSGRMRNAGRFTGEDRAFDVYLSARFEPAPVSVQLFRDGELLDGVASATGVRSGALVRFADGTRHVLVRAGVSYIDVQAARGNRAEVDGRSFDAVHEDARTRWRELLMRVEIEGGSDAEQRIFYTALYHSLLMPTTMSEADGRSVGLDRQVHDDAGFVYHSDFSMWDTYRTLHPLLGLLYPDKQRDLSRTLLAMAAQHGALPRWPLAVNETGTMLGSPASIILADSAARGVVDFDLPAALDAMVADADGVAGRSIRGGVAQCLAAGYCPADQVGRGVANTLEYAWADFAIANLARQLGDDGIEARFRSRVGGYAGLWDPTEQFLRGRNADGSWSQQPFDPEVWTEDFAEGNAWQYLWATPFDVPTFAALFGSVDAMLDKLDTFFELSEATPRPMLVEPFSGYDLYYWHGNEPDIHAAYLYALAGQPGRGARWIDWVRRSKYSDGPDGLDGNDDAGTLSSWYVFSALGLYPLAGSDVYVVGTPLFKRAVLHLAGGDLVIEAPAADATHLQVQGLGLHGQPQRTPYLRHADLAQGGSLQFTMGAGSSSWGEGEPLDLSR
ncbi:MAG: GH92 family glycosyl hydrolase [Pseudomonadota bacterium]